MTYELDVEQAKLKLEIARDMLGGNVSFIEGARFINGLRWYADIPEFDPDFVTFVAIDSETDAFPFGQVREFWAPDALMKLQPQIDQAERWAEEFGRAACQKIIDRFEPLQNKWR